MPFGRITISRLFRIFCEEITVNCPTLMNICLGEEYLRLQGTSTENFFFTALFPWLCAVGIVGNCLNLMVLLSTEVRHRSAGFGQRSNVLLVVLAFCDILFLILMIPHSLANFDYFGLNLMFRTWYLPTKVHLISLANWCSAVTIWLVIAICAERLIGIRSLQHSNVNWSYCSTAHLVITIVAGSALLTFYNHFAYHCIVKQLCNETQIISKCFDVIQETWPGNHANLTPQAIRVYVRWSQVANVLIVIVLPILIMLALNIALLYVVRKQSFLVYSRLHCGASTNSEYGAPQTVPVTQNGVNCAKCRRKVSSASNIVPVMTAVKVNNEIQRRISNATATVPVVVASLSRNGSCSRMHGNNGSCCANGGAEQPTPRLPSSRKNSAVIVAQSSADSGSSTQTQSSLFRRSIDQTVQFQAEHRVTVTVCAIVTCFTITQGPSAIILSISFLSGHKPPFVNSNALWYQANSLTGFLVIIGKTMNFILFCLSSAAFRRRLTNILRKKLLFLKSRRSSFLGNSSTGGGAAGGIGCGGAANATHTNHTVGAGHPAKK